MLTLARKVIRDFRGRRLRNALTLLGVILGVAGVVAIATANHDVLDAQRLTYDASSQADLAAFTGDLSTTTLSLIERNENVETAESRSAVLTRFSTSGSQHSVRIFGIDDFSTMRLDIVDLDSGRFPGRGEVAFDASVNDLEPVNIGDVVAIQRTPDDEITYLTVSGFTRSPATLGAGITNRALAYTGVGEVRQMTERRADNYLLVRMRDIERTSQTASEIAGLLGKRGVSTGTIEVRDSSNFVGARELNTLLLMLRIFSILGAVLASFLVANTLSAVISEETTQIGVLKAIGGQTRHVVLTYLMYSAVIGAVGSAAGLAVGVYAGRALAAYLTDLTGLKQPQLTIQPLEVVLAILVGFAVTIGATMIPSVRNALKPVARLLHSPAIRSEYRSRLLLNASRPIAHVSYSVAVGIRNAIRRPGRAAVTIAVVAVAVAAFVSTQALSDSVSGTADELYDLYGADGWIFFRRGADLSIARQLKQEPFVLDAEPWTNQNAAIGSTRTDVWGMPVEDPLYQYRLVDGTWLRNSNPPSVVLTSNLAESLDRTVNDSVELDLDSRRVTVHIVGIVDDPSTYLGNAGTGKIFMTIGDLHAISARGTRADLIALKLRDQDPAEVDSALAILETRYRDLGPGTLAAHTDRESTQQAIGILTQLLRVMVVVVGVVGVSGIANTLIINISERRHEIGVLRAIGAQSRHLIGMLVSEGIAIAVTGILIGVLVGYPIARFLVTLTGNELFELTFLLDARTLGASLAIGLLAVAATATIPGLFAARLKPIKVLRYE